MLTMKENTTFHLKYLKNLIGDEGSSVELYEGYSRKIVLNPTHLDNVKASVREILNCTITTFDKTLNGIILNYKDVKIPEYLPINEDGTFSVDITADVYVFKPRIGNVLKGTVNIKSQNHMSCLVHHVFIVAIQESLDPEQNECGKNQLNIGDEVIFRIVDIDLNEYIPYIKGLLIDFRIAEGEHHTSVSAVSKKKKRIVNINDKNHEHSVYLKGADNECIDNIDVIKTDDENLTGIVKVKKKHKKKEK